MVFFGNAYIPPICHNLGPIREFSLPKRYSSEVQFGVDNSSESDGGSEVVVYQNPTQRNRDNRLRRRPSSSYDDQLTVGRAGADFALLSNIPTYKIHCKAGGERYAVAIRNAKLVLTHPNPFDLTQCMVENSHSIKVKDEEGNKSFILINKGTGEAVKHSVSGFPVQLITYKPDVFDGSIMWTKSKNLGSSFTTIRMVNNVRLVMDAWNGDKDHGGIRDGTILALFRCWKGDNQNQQWKFVLVT